MTSTEIGERLRIIRTYRGWSQKRLGAIVHGDQTKICGFQKGRSIPFTEMGLMAKALCFDMNVLYTSTPFDLMACLLPMPVEPGPEQSPADS